VLSAGFADAPVSDRQLVRMGLQCRRAGSQALVGYIWAINLRRVTGFRCGSKEDGQVFSEQTTEPLDRSKAVYVAYSGKKGSPDSGTLPAGNRNRQAGSRIVVGSREFTLK
jgi:hypothetical protein